ncbi:MAG: chromate efflux transporter [Thermodesulfovibrio sp.]|nr:chromate efflux transporter [Thermodesulfovibrio sp.]
MTNLISIFLAFLRLGLTAFGGPAMVANIKQLAVEERKWLDKESFQEGVAIAQTIPGPIAMHVAAYVGLKIRGLSGAIVSFVGFGLPAFIMMIVLSVLYKKTNSIPEVVSIFKGLQVVVIAIILNATFSFAKPIIKSKGKIAVALFSFTLFTLNLNPFLIIIICFLISQIIFKEEISIEKTSSRQINFSGLFALIITLFGFLSLLFFYDKDLFILALTMMKIDLFAFGGAYALLPLMFHEFVDKLKWLDEKTFMDGLALGQITPGPIVITATFVGYLIKGLIGALVATIAVFSPSFIIMIFATEVGDRIKNSKIFNKAKKGLLASFSGLLLFVSLKFINTVSWDLIKLLILVLSLLCIIKRVNILYVVIVGSVISIVFFN